MPSNRFRKTYRELSPAEQERIEQVKDKALALSIEYDLIAAGGRSANPELHRQIALAQTNLEQSVMWAVKAAT